MKSQLVGVGIILWLVSTGLCAEIYLLATQPTNSQIEHVFDKELGQKLLFHKPFDLPLEVERTNKAMVKHLQPWVALGFVNQESTRFLAEKMMYGEPREVSVGGYKYTLNLENELVNDQGIYYGRPKVKSILEVGQVNESSGEYFCEVYLSWYAEDLADWVNTMDLTKRENRLLRRAKESEEKPFEKRLQLILIQNEWQLWQGRGEKKSLQTLF